MVSLIFQMFLSVIIDYFNETRERSETFNETMETECIICGISREKIEKINPNDKMAFDKHITNCHNVFNYLYYLMYLQSIDDKDVIIGRDTEYITAFPANAESAIEFHGPEKEYDHYKITYKTEKTEYSTSHFDDVEVEAKDNKEDEEVDDGE